MFHKDKINVVNLFEMEIIVNNSVSERKKEKMWNIYVDKKTFPDFRTINLQKNRFPHPSLVN